MQHVADGIADTLNEGRKADGVRSGRDRNGAAAHGFASGKIAVNRCAGSPGAAVYRPNTKGERLHSLSLFSCPANSPKTAEPLPDIEA